MPKALTGSRRPLTPIHTVNYDIFFTEEDKGVAFAHSLEIQCQTNIYPDADNEHMDLVQEIVEDLRKEEPTTTNSSAKPISTKSEPLSKALSRGKPQVPIISLIKH
ncbi:hypothetical protein Zmor_006574 [Zophobas morio]|uniref:Uncharacterized protein n=1 Tax=Zophobas morio TaxID=2755281 RepID=A0AA38IQC3_9CUCU|nr:hypothetical protein Zmor_006574 [Zophobas morio]